MRTVRDVALRLLARREHSQKEMQQKLLQKGFALSDITPVLIKLQDDDLLSDQRFIDIFIRSKRRQGSGPLKICAELQKYGIDLNQVQASEEWQQTSWEVYALAVRTKRFGEAFPQTLQEKWQQTRFLQQRGFTPDQIRSAFLGDT